MRTSAMEYPSTKFCVFDTARSGFKFLTETKMAEHFFFFINATSRFPHALITNNLDNRKSWYDSGRSGTHIGNPRMIPVDTGTYIIGTPRMIRTEVLRRTSAVWLLSCLVTTNCIPTNLSKLRLWFTQRDNAKWRINKWGTISLR